MSRIAYFVGIDAGTSSVRAAVFDEAGQIQGISVVPVKIYEGGGHYEQSSSAIWQSCCQAVKTAILSSKVELGAIKGAVFYAGFGISATASLVALDAEYKPVSVSADNDDSKNTIMWMDHRAADQVVRASASPSDFLKRNSGSVSPELSAAKVLWLYEKSSNWPRMAHLFCLPDYLTFMATGCLNRSVSCLVCKWGFESETNTWSSDFWRLGGLKDADFDELISKCGGGHGKSFNLAGSKISTGISRNAAIAFGFPALEGVAVGVALVDNFAGALATLAISETSLEPSITHRMAIISGTSSSHIVVSNHHEFITGICGPYDDAILSGFSCYESGQNLTGKVLETLLAHHPLYPAFVEKLALSNDSMFDQLNASVFAYAAEQNHTFPALLAKNFHIYPELHGNRSPTSDPMLRGMISGLQVPVRTPSRLPSPTMTLFYYSTLLGICYGTRHIIDTHKTSGIVIADIVLSGALCSNSLFAQSLADVAQCRVIVGSCGGEQTPLLGGAISAAAAYHTTNVSQKLWDCMKNMTAPDHIYEPAGPDVLAFHDRKYRVYLKMLHDQLEYRSMMHE